MSGLKSYLHSEPENNSCMVLKRFYEEHISKCKKGVEQGLAHDKCLTIIIYLWGTIYNSDCFTAYVFWFS